MESAWFTKSLSLHNQLNEWQKLGISHMMLCTKPKVFRRPFQDTSTVMHSIAYYSSYPYIVGENDIIILG